MDKIVNYPRIKIVPKVQAEQAPPIELYCRFFEKARPDRGNKTHFYHLDFSVKNLFVNIRAFLQQEVSIRQRLFAGAMKIKQKVFAP